MPTAYEHGKEVPTHVPDRMKIGAVTWKVERTKEINDDLLGQAVLRNHRILLAVDQSDENAEQVFIHELLHVCAEMAGLLPDAKYSEEAFVNAVANPLHSALRENGFWPKPPIKK